MSQSPVAADPPPMLAPAGPGDRPLAGEDRLVGGNGATVGRAAPRATPAADGHAGLGRIQGPDGPPLGDVDALLEPHLVAAVAALDGAGPLLAGMGRYGLGWVTPDLAPAPAAEGAAHRGKRLRPRVALLCCAAAGGDPATAAPLGAALELLHNFTLVHDDIQDRSPTRRHRPTVWALWGEGQAINAGDALFAAAHLAVYRLRAGGTPAETTLRLAEAFDRMTIEIVRGQTLDLGFEGRDDVTPTAYLEMIAGKTAAIVRHAAWAGALLGGADDATADRFAAFGLALGLGFQVRDDALGIWGAPETTGKAAADDIRRRKQSLPILLLRAAADPAARAELDALYAAAEIDGTGVARVLALLEVTGVRAEVETRVRAFHDEARAALLASAPVATPARAALLALVEGLAARET